MGRYYELFFTNLHLLQITLASGGMLVQKLNTDDPQSERTAFDGTMVYAQNKVSEGLFSTRSPGLFSMEGLFWDTQWLGSNSQST